LQAWSSCTTISISTAAFRLLLRATCSFGCGLLKLLLPKLLLLLELLLLPNQLPQLLLL